MKADAPIAEPFKAANSLRIPDTLYAKSGSIEQLRRDVRDWMIKNTKHRWRVDSHSYELLPFIEVWSEIAFESDRDATLFKMFWL